MSKRLTNGSPAWSRRQATATRGRIPGRWRCSSVSVSPSRKPMTRTPSSGRKSTTGAPTPVAAARTLFSYSARRSTASSSVEDGLEWRSTYVPSGVVIL